MLISSNFVPKIGVSNNYSKKSVPFKGEWEKTVVAASEPYEGIEDKHIYHPYKDETQEEIRHAFIEKFGRYPFYRDLTVCDQDRFHAEIGSRLDTNKPKISNEELKRRELNLMDDIKSAIKSTSSKFIKVADLCAEQNNKAGARGALEASRVLRDMGDLSTIEKIQQVNATKKVLEKMGDNESAEGCQKYIDQLIGQN